MAPETRWWTAAADHPQPLCVTCHCSDCSAPCCLGSGFELRFLRLESLKLEPAGFAVGRKFDRSGVAKVKEEQAAGKRVDEVVVAVACR